MVDGLANWMQHNPKVIWVMGVPLIFFVGHSLLQDNIARGVCGIIAACTMTAVTIMAVITGRWNDLMWPCMGFIAWSVMRGITKEFD